jgi:hypothetical protein
LSRPVYTKRLFVAPGFSGGPTTVFSSPAGVVTVVTCITIVWGDVTLSDLDAWVQLSDLTKILRQTLHGGSSVPTVIGGSMIWYGRFALTEAEELQVQTADGTADFSATGYELALP